MKAEVKVDFAWPAKDGVVNYDVHGMPGAGGKQNVSDTLNADTDEAGHAFQSQAGRVFRFEGGHRWRHSHGSTG
ncbi:hypothetical protein [Bosea sp. (in: a-proteobacteria)]|uniref:hypothetical protein n=1 Tax=Bosea sp. (in: a-proteobacteria) TaxID=1871050 RepID=UPI002B45AB27|nr:hypothetical protein [Bosea sp. (in: a-proteobacteria)]WRH56752.1 MAG: hypothetical protein RSE11_17150 [Bosea sp. (in: a-proteobacteria)]